MITGYTNGSFDMFHIGHLNFIRRAREQCDKLTIAVNSDELIYSYKYKYPIILANDRKEILDLFNKSIHRNKQEVVI
jgi:glycerol-3-phosphate cytidylyltransferase